MPSVLGDYIDLKPDSSLIDPNFDGYKLSLDNFRHYDFPLPLQVRHLQASNSQFGLEHLKLFNDLNYLYYDGYNSTVAVKLFYSILEDLHLHSFAFDVQENRFSSAQLEHKVTVEHDASSEDNRYPTTLSFVDPTYAFIANGTGGLSMFETGKRNGHEQWKELLTLTVEVCGSKIGPCVIAESRRFTDDRIEVLLRSVVLKEKSRETKAKGLFWNKFYWLTLNPENGNWYLKRTREVTCDGHVEMVTLDFNGGNVILVGAEEYSFTFDSDKDAMEVEEGFGPDENGQKTDDEIAAGDKKEAAYLWTQTSEDLTAVFKFPEKVSKTDVLMSLEASSIHLSHKGSDLLNGRLGGLVDVSSSTFTIDGGKLELTLFKAEPSAWTELVIGNTRGVYEVDKDAMAAAYNRLEQFTSEFSALGESGANQTFNTGQLEDCDMSSDEIVKILWICGDTHTVKHQSDISGNTPLFTLSVLDEPRNLCLRMDVDGILWSFSKEDTRLLTHKATFNALGYVQASKTQKKFCTCSPDCSYAAIIEAKRRAYIYWQPAALESDLRNRRSGRRVTGIAKQHLVSISKQGEFGEAEAVSNDIVGVYADNSALFLLTTRELFAIVLN